MICKLINCEMLHLEPLCSNKEQNCNAVLTSVIFHLGLFLQWNLLNATVLWLKTPTLYFEDPRFNPLNTELNPICHLLALLGAHPILHVSRIRVNSHLVILIKVYCGFSHSFRQILVCSLTWAVITFFFLQPAVQLLVTNGMMKYC